MLGRLYKTGSMQPILIKTPDVTTTYLHDPQEPQEKQDSKADLAHGAPLHWVDHHHR